MNGLNDSDGLGNGVRAACDSSCRSNGIDLSPLVVVWKLTRALHFNLKCAPAVQHSAHVWLALAADAHPPIAITKYARLPAFNTGYFRVFSQGCEDVAQDVSFERYA